MDVLVHALRRFAVEFEKHRGRLRLDPEYESLFEGARAAVLKSRRSEEE
jgi:hypothetical protein